MADETYADPDPANAAGLRVVDDGGCFRLSFLSFEGVPMSASITVPKKSSVQGVQKFFRTLMENEDIYVALLKDHLVEHPINPPETAKKKPTVGTGSLRKRIRGLK